MALVTMLTPFRPDKGAHQSKDMHLVLYQLFMVATRYRQLIHVCAFDDTKTS
jgi:hypothetical protein